MINKTSRRRFIAGATCPQCGETDKVFTQIRTKEMLLDSEKLGSENKFSGNSESKNTVEEKERGCIVCDFLEVISDVEQDPVISGDWSPVKLLD
ncbi:MAG: hypothetical protein ACJAVI_005715 [Candidatus Azotimanducaceae bacterium]|jgi:hypothetical protein